MPDPEREIEEFPDEVDHTCEENHVADLDDAEKIILSTFATIRSKIEDLNRAQSDIKRFELSIEADRKRLQKTLEAAKVGLRNARVQMGVELEKLDSAGFAGAAKLLKESSLAV